MKQPKCPPTGEWTHTNTHTQEYYLAIKKEIIPLPTYSNRSGSRDYHTR